MFLLKICASSTQSIVDAEKLPRQFTEALFAKRACAVDRNLVKQKIDDRKGLAGTLSAQDLAALYRDSYKKLTCIAAGVLGRLEDAEDMVQMAVSIAIDKKEQFESGNHFVAWLCTTVRNCSLNHRRKIIGRKTLATDPVVMAAITNVPDVANKQPIDSTSGQLLPDQNAFDDEVLRALQSLPEESRTCLLLRIVLNLSYTELSELTGLPEGTAMSHVHRGKKKLRDLLGTGQMGQGGAE